ncbi:hypothetical protein MKW98_009870 [Papaver atlanticum]|uniref:Kinesin motor domain-containing protein n=1 Tax=Papaver atlanticum TaxID=357466 RepID=A0AAD4XT43_9MAGN|nr:hypothetical protein MKW98_009870 [Papaver atlanticum]
MEFLIKVSFIEIYREQVYDLLKPKLPISKRKRTVAKVAAPAKEPLRIQGPKGVFTIPDVTEPEVRTKQQMASFFSQGSSARATGSTNMNSESSLSHAIFTISMEQRRSTCIPGDDPGDGILRAKLLLVDLAGSGSASGTDGLRQEEGISINKGILALEQVISALGERKEGGHVRYLDSTLTRLLKDSLGGNSKTVMIACVSPANSNARATQITLIYASCARNIQNKKNSTTQMQRKDNFPVLQARNGELDLKLHHAQVEKDKSWAEIDAVHGDEIADDVYGDETGAVQGDETDDDSLRSSKRQKRSPPVEKIITKRGRGHPPKPKKKKPIGRPRKRHVGRPKKVR